MIFLHAVKQSCVCLSLLQLFYFVTDFKDTKICINVGCNSCFTATE